MMSLRKGRMVKLQISGRNLTDLDLFTKSDPYLVISRLNQYTNQLSQVRRTETINNELNPDWPVLYMSLQELCNNDMNLPLQLDVYDEDNKNQELIGSAVRSLAELESCMHSKEMIGLEYKGRSRGNLIIQLCYIDPPSFQERVSASAAPGTWTDQQIYSAPVPPTADIQYPGYPRSSLDNTPVYPGRAMDKTPVFPASTVDHSPVYPRTSIDNTPVYPPHPSGFVLPTAYPPAPSTTDLPYPVHPPAQGPRYTQGPWIQ